MEQGNYNHAKNHQASYPERGSMYNNPGFSPGYQSQGFRLPQAPVDPGYYPNAGIYGSEYADFDPSFDLGSEFMFGNYNQGMLPMINMMSMQNLMYQNNLKQGEPESNHNELMAMGIEGILALFSDKIRD